MVKNKSKLRKAFKLLVKSKSPNYELPKFYTGDPRKVIPLPETK